MPIKVTDIQHEIYLYQKGNIAHVLKVFFEKRIGEFIVLDRYLENRSYDTIEESISILK